MLRRILESVTNACCSVSVVAVLLAAAAGVEPLLAVAVVWMKKPRPTRIWRLI